MIACVSIEPVEDETLISQLVRLAEANGLRSVADVHRRIGKQPPSLTDLVLGPSQRWLEAAAEMTGIDATCLLSGTRHGRRSPVVRAWNPALAANVAMYCPACLATDGAWRLSWLVPFAEVCSIHDLLLVDHREHCADPDGIERRWSVAESTDRLCNRRSCTLALSAFVADPAPWHVLAKYGRLREIEAEFRFRVLNNEYVDLPTGRYAPQVLDAHQIKPRERCDPSVRIEWRDRPDQGIAHRAGDR